MASASARSELGCGLSGEGAGIDVRLPSILRKWETGDDPGVNRVKITASLMLRWRGALGGGGRRCGRAFLDLKGLRHQKQHLLLRLGSAAGAEERGAEAGGPF